MKNNKDLQNYLEDNNIKAEILKLDGNTKTAHDAANVLNVDKKHIVKSVVFIRKSGKPIIAIVSGEDRVSFDKIERYIKETINTASSEEVLKSTGYIAGGVPPIGTGIETFIDEKIDKMDICFAGGGTINHILKISAKDIIKFSRGIIFDIKK
ncbi:hypothetical protein HYX19_04525 [Candidatus Woesearchaeota archaeon]|nr:hypothetical protein [Candidatus Woesearchaeota archaeon]